MKNNKNKEYIYLIGAFERDNVGDILFPKVISKFLNNYQIVNISPLTANLKNINGDIVLSKKSISTQKIIKPKAVIHCGGETITCKIDDALKMDISSNAWNSNDTKGLIENLSGKNYFGYLYNHKDLNIESNVPISYFSIGGSSEEFYKNVDFINNISKHLNIKNNIYIRDIYTKKFLNEYLKIDTNITPDIVNIISYTHKKIIKKTKNNNEYKTIKNLKPYITFQANNDYILKHGIELIAKELIEIAQTDNKSIIFQAAGIANYHDSISLFKSIEKIINDINPKIKTYIQSNRNVWFQVSVLSDSYCNICSSLHHKIISNSFIVPSISLTNTKVTKYLESWPDKTNIYNIEANNISNIYFKLIKKIDFNAFKKYQNNIQKNVLDSLFSLFKQINLNYNEKPKYKKHNIDKVINSILINEIKVNRKNILKNNTKINNISYELDIIKNSKLFKLWPIYCKLKNILLSIKK